MRAFRWVAVASALCGLIAASFTGPTVAENFGSVNMTWKTVPLISMTIEPNYQTGYGPTGGTGSGSTPAPGGLASAGGGWIDFGNVVQGYDYLYKYALKASVMTNDFSGFSLYAEGAADSVGETDSAIMPLNTTLYWLTSSSGNNPFSTATAFQKTSGAVTGCPVTGPPATCTIGYTTYPTPIWSYPNETIGQPGNVVSQGYDYELRLAGATHIEKFYVWIVYTAVGN
jgi:hypothetical protein